MMRRRTDHAFQDTPPRRSVEYRVQNGVIVLNKPPGPTSHQATSYLKDILGIDKAGHGGTLDPNVTGVLPVALQEKTKLTHAILGSPKEYVGLLYLHGDVSDRELYECFDDYTGVIEQLPPVKSAVKREVRERKIYSLDVLSREGRSVLVRVGCEGGTYIRKLFHDIGEDLGVNAHMQELHRTKAGPFTTEDMYTLHEVKDFHAFWEQGRGDWFDDVVLEPEEAVSHLPKIIVHDSTKKSLSHGAYLKVPGIVACDADIEAGDKVAVLSQGYELLLIGVAEMRSRDLLRADRGVAVNTSQVYFLPKHLDKV